MTNDNGGSRFEPVLLDLADTDDYITVIHALEEYASQQEGSADDEQDRIRYNKLPESESDEGDYRMRASRARDIASDIERQLDANSAARKAVNGPGE